MTWRALSISPYWEGTFAGNGPFAEGPPHDVLVKIDTQDAAGAGRAVQVEPS